MMTVSHNKAEDAGSARVFGLPTSIVALGLCALLCLLAWAARSPLHDLPLERDEGAYALIAQRWLAGDVLYRDLFDHKPPLVYAVYALAPLAQGEPVRGVRTVASAYLLLGGLALAALAWRLYGRWAAPAALALFFAYSSSLSFQGLIFNSEAVMALPAILGCLAAVAALGSGRPALLALAGVCVGLAALAKPVGAALLAPLLLAPLAARWSLRQRLAGMVAATVGALLPLGGFLLYLWRHDAVPEAYEALVVYNRLYAAESLELGWDLGLLWRVWAPMLALGLPAFVGLALTLRAPDPRRGERLVAALWGAALLTTALLSIRAYPHYYLAAVPFLSLWAGAGIVWLSRRLGRGRGWLGPALGGALLLALVTPPLREIWPLRAQSPQEQITTMYGLDGAMFFGTAGEVALYIADRVAPDEPIFVWASEPEIYLLANRRPATRFVYDYPVERLPGARDDLIRTLREVGPPLIITYHAVRPMGFHPFMDDYRYTLRATIGGYDIFQRE